MILISSAYALLLPPWYDMNTLLLSLADESVFAHCKNLFGIIKLMMVKMTVGLITAQGLVESFLVATNSAPYNDDDQFSADEKAQRGYCKSPTPYPNLTHITRSLTG